MKILITHLSDIHIKSDSDLIYSRIDHIAAAVSSNSNISACIIAVSGDIANWGLESEYEIALSFFNALSSKIIDRVQDIKEVFLVFAPGNHDCDFTSNKKEVEKRDAILPAINSSINTLEAESGLVEQCLSIQSNFFKFVSKITDSDPIATEKQLFYKYDFSINGKKIRFNCYNTAWLSQKDEQQGQLLFPTQIAKQEYGIEPENSDLVVSLFHHPYNWLESNNSHTFIKFIERTSDLVLTGHEHIRDVFNKEKITGENTRYFSGDVLQERGSKVSGFNVVLIDLETKKQNIIHYKWNENLYKKKHETNWIPFLRNRSLLSQTFINNDEFESRLLDTGAIFVHPFKKERLRLNDLFVYPEIRELTVRPSKGAKEREVNNENLAEHLLERRYSIIYGEEYSGKTAIAKILYKEFQNKEFVPIIVRAGHDFSNCDDELLQGYITSVFIEQYSAELVDKFYQIPIEKRILIIDDFHKFHFLGDYQIRLLHTAKKIFHTIIIFASDVYQLQSIVQHDEEKEDILLTFSQNKIKEFGRTLRGELINKWLKLGREKQINQREISHEERQLENVLNAIISGNVIPSYPFWILSILQTWNTDQSKNGNYGAFGYVYNELITRQLRELGYDSTKIDTVYTILGKVAYYLFDNEQDTLTLFELNKINDDYHADYRIREDINEILKNLTKARILRENDEFYQFTQPYIFYFFVARHIQENLAAGKNKDELTSKVLHMIEYIGYEPYSYILLILVYLTKNRIFIEKIIENSQQIYREMLPCDLDKDVEFLNKINVKPQTLQLPEGNADENRKEYRKQIDELEEVESEFDESIVPYTSPKLIRYSPDLNDLTKITIGLRNLDLMGQILRNFPGSLFGDIKLKLTEETYSLGLRILQALLKGAEENFEDFRAHYKKVIKESRSYMTDSEAALSADGLILWLTTGAGFGMIKRISAAVGHEKLQEIYAEVKRNLKSTTAVELIDLTIRLDHFRGVPHTDINKLEKKTIKDNRFSYRILRDLIGHFLFLFPVDVQDKQKLVNKFDIQTSQTNLLLNDFKRTTKKTSGKRRKKKR